MHTWSKKAYQVPVWENLKIQQGCFGLVGRDENMPSIFPRVIDAANEQLNIRTTLPVVGMEVLHAYVYVRSILGTTYDDDA